MRTVLAVKEHWEQDLTQVSGLGEQVSADLDAIWQKVCGKPLSHCAKTTTDNPAQAGFSGYKLVTTYCIIYVINPVCNFRAASF